jgi:hypothetical protein
MFRNFLVPAAIGIVFFLSVYFILPEFFSESSIVSYVAEFLLGQSNLYFDPMPAILARYVADLNLLVIALTGAVLSAAIIGLVVIISSLFISIIRSIVLFLRKIPKTEKTVDLAPIDLDPQINKFARGKKVVGKGFDSIDQV